MTNTPTPMRLHRPPVAAAGLSGSTIVADSVRVVGGDGGAVIDDISLSLRPGELTAIVGASGAGKSTLLRALVGDVDVAAGHVTVGGSERSDAPPGGFVPQDDDVPMDLPLGRMLRYGARLRLPAGSTRVAVDLAVERALRLVDLDAMASTPVARLSGGQRRRASIALELVSNPGACLLDEPTSGLDPSTAHTVVDELRALADRGATIAFSTHHAADLTACDRIVAIAPGGRIAFDGSVDEAIALTDTGTIDAVHRALIGLPPTPSSPGTIAPVTPATPPIAWQRPRRSRQWWTLTVRSLDAIVRNRLTLGIMLGSPAMVIAMFAILFEGGAFDPADPSPTSAIMIAFWIAFGGFFFGLTYGLLQICTEIPVMRRERRAGVGTGVQIGSKIAALAPVLVLIDVAMLGVLGWLDRLPTLSSSTFVTLAVTLILDAVAALALGLLASAAVSSPSQASLALPMLCFPAVLFSGAILPVPVMASAGRAISAVMSDRWAFEAIGRDLDLRWLLAEGDAPLGRELLVEFGDTWTISHAAAWSTLLAFAVVLSLAAWIVLERRCRPSGARRRSVPSGIGTDPVI